MLGDAALKLVTESKACLNLDTVKPYNDELVRMLVLETKQLHTHMQSLLSLLETSTAVEVAGLQSQLLMLHLVVQTNKRALLIYHNVRTDLLTSALNNAHSLPTLLARSPAMKAGLAPHEIEYLKHYAGLIQTVKVDYMHSAPSLQLDIMDQHPDERPPTNLLVTIKVLKPLNDVWLSHAQSAPSSFQKDQTLTISHADVRPLINRGWVALVDSDP
ncbi:GINS complex, Psf1 component [Moesziomyces antarcticus]|uniref:DNA replication complex GINS protein PSF1 n=1 Tax=Pseudozyma antarctica TaxID=84753 RepID=A0A081CNQ5_PSEA2|nr:GINS complex, Psf1 component [Moesziomyces antarcticus]GAK68301.1 GINS complex, Psf1 component [Moesziomyces antarcticus]